MKCIENFWTKLLGAEFIILNDSVCVIKMSSNMSLKYIKDVKFCGCFHEKVAIHLFSPFSILKLVCFDRIKQNFRVLSKRNLNIVAKL